jgi:hypothetical protein
LETRGSILKGRTSPKGVRDSVPPTAKLSTRQIDTRVKGGLALIHILWYRMTEAGERRDEPGRVKPPDGDGIEGPAHRSHQKHALSPDTAPSTGNETPGQPHAGARPNTAVIAGPIHHPSTLYRGVFARRFSVFPRRENHHETKEIRLPDQSLD